jgi:CheY-like chemotaxis protein
MKNEPSVLLIDDESKNEGIVRGLDLDAEGWTVECAIDEEVHGALKKAREKVAQYGGFTVILLDILWPYGKRGGIEILSGLKKDNKGDPPARQVLILTKGAGAADIQAELDSLAEELHIPPDMRSMQLFTTHDAERLKKALLRLWRQWAPKDRSA